jgi:cysteinyl-tRNA synthetase
VAVQDDKEDPLDFVLWKSAKPDEPDDAKWPSRYGPGRPGWHIECSAMSCALLGEPFDIHGGGMDLQFPHHENEIAQSEGAHGGPFVNTWMHNGFLNVDNEKMSKSLGNFFTIADVLKRFDGETVRFFMLRTHYRSPFNFSDGNSTMRAVRCGACTPRWRPGDGGRRARHRLGRAAAAAFKAAMDDDFNTPARWPCCSNWPASQPRPLPMRPLLLRRWAARWACCSRPARLPAGRRGSGRSHHPGASRPAPPPRPRDFAEADRIRAELLRRASS